MKWNQKGIIACVILFFVIIGALMVQGVQKTNNQEDAHYALEEDVVSVEKKETAKPELTKSVEPTKTPKQKTAVSTSTPKEKIKGKNTEKPTAKPAAVTAPKKDKGNKTEKKSGENVTKKSVSTEKPVTVKPTEKQTEKPKNEVSFEIECKKILKKKELWKNGLEEVIPASGIYYSGKCSFTAEESVYDILKRITKENNIALDSEFTPMYGTYYVKGIGGLYQFDCGSKSGWMYSVNGMTPNVGASNYQVSNGDVIVFYYVCEYEY